MSRPTTKVELASHTPWGDTALCGTERSTENLGPSRWVWLPPRCPQPASIGVEVVADDCSSGAIAAPDASSERRVGRAVSGATTALAAAECAVGGTATTAAVEASPSSPATVEAACGAIASSSE
jgi:hypothetical protein